MKNKKLTILFLILTFNFKLALLHSAFVDLGTGARPLGMGNAFVAVADDANTVLYNPAGLAQLKREEATLTYSQLYVGIDGLSSGFASYVRPINRKYGSFGIGWYNFTTKDLYNENTILLSYGYQILSQQPILFGGLNLKYLAKEYKTNEWTAVNPVFASGTTADGYSIDLGLLCKVNKMLSLGLSIENINQPDISLQSTDKVPMSYRVGAAYKLKELGPVNSLTITLEDANISKTNTIRAGAEGWFMENTLAARLGFSNRDISLGAGYVFKIKDSDGQLDYAFISPLNFIDSVSGTHRISLGLKFGELLEESEDYEEEEYEYEEGEEETEGAVSPDTPAKVEGAAVTTPIDDKDLKKKARKTYLEAVKLYSRKTYLKAFDKFSYVLKLNPSDRLSPRYINRMRSNMEQTVNKFKKEKDLQYAVGYISYVDSKIDIAINVWKKLLIIDPNNQEVKEYLNKYSKKGAQPAGNVPEVTTPQQESQPARLAPKPEEKKPEVPVKPSANEDDENEDEEEEEEEE